MNIKTLENKVKRLGQKVIDLIAENAPEEKVNDVLKKYNIAYTLYRSLKDEGE